MTLTELKAFEEWYSENRNARPADMAAWGIAYGIKQATGLASAEYARGLKEGIAYERKRAGLANAIGFEEGIAYERKRAAGVIKGLCEALEQVRWGEPCWCDDQGGHTGFCADATRALAHAAEIEKGEP